jgi:hypothetical protein
VTSLVHVAAVYLAEKADPLGKEGALPNANHCVLTPEYAYRISRGAVCCVQYLYDYTKC